MIGVVQRKDTGRPEFVYGRRCKIDQIEHQVRIAEVALHFYPRPFTCDAKVGDTEADLLLDYDGIKCWVEVDNSEKMTAKQMGAKWKRYGTFEGFVLVVCQTEGRMHRLRKTADVLGNAVLLTTFDRLLSGRPWVDRLGNPVDLDKPPAGKTTA